jgi:hypothetical protein
MSTYKLIKKRLPFKVYSLLKGIPLIGTSLAGCSSLHLILAQILRIQVLEPLFNILG